MRTLKCLILCFFCAAAMAQDIQSILDRNPFDPDRGKEEAEPTGEDEPEVVPIDLPVLDGTIIAGGTRIALFTYMLEGKPASARVTVNEDVGQYKVTSIERQKVELSSDGGDPIPVALYSGAKDKRGGTKSVPKPQAKGKGGLKKVNGKKPPSLVKNDPTQRGKKVDNRNKNSNKKFNPRRPPRESRNKKVEQTKKRF